MRHSQRFARVFATSALLVLTSQVGAQSFRRGDCNSDCGFNIADPIALAEALFLSASPPSCAKACDGNDDGALDISDVVSMLSALFGSSTIPLPAPYLSCGVDPTPDALDCEVGSCTGPVADALVVSVQGTNVLLSWNCTDASSGFDSVRVLRALNSPPAGPDDPSAQLVYEGAGESTTESLTALLPDTTAVPRTYHYSVFGCTSGIGCAPIGSTATLTPTVTQCLVAGGYMIFFRHSAATVCSDQTVLGTAATTTVPGWWTSCATDCPPLGTATARQLDSTGVFEAISIGVDMAARGIPVGRVISSEYCRCFQTAELMNFGLPIELNQGISFFVYDEPNRCANCFAVLAEAAPPGANGVIIGHAGMVCPVLGSLLWSEAAIYKPDGAGGTEYITRLLFDEWLTLP